MWSRSSINRKFAKSVYPKTIARNFANMYKVGDPKDPKTMMGPIASYTQYKSILEYINKGLKEGATLIAGGATKPEGL